MPILLAQRFHRRAGRLALPKVARGTEASNALTETLVVIEQRVTAGSRGAVGVAS